MCFPSKNAFYQVLARDVTFRGASRQSVTTFVKVGSQIWFHIFRTRIGPDRTFCPSDKRTKSLNCTVRRSRSPLSSEFGKKKQSRPDSGLALSHFQERYGEYIKSFPPRAAAAHFKTRRNCQLLHTWFPGASTAGLPRSQEKTPIPPESP